MQEHGDPGHLRLHLGRSRQPHAGAARPGPGEAGYQQQLADYNTAFGAFFERLKSDGIDKSNTLFIVTVDEGDHFAGGTGSPDRRTARSPTHTHRARPRR